MHAESSPPGNNYRYSLVFMPITAFQCCMLYSAMIEKLKLGGRDQTLDRGLQTVHNGVKKDTSKSYHNRSNRMIGRHYNIIKLFMR